MITYRPMLFVSLVAALVLLNGITANADVLTPTNATCSNYFDQCEATNLINGLAMTMEGDVSTWYHTPDPGGYNMWMNNGGTVANEWVKFDLGKTYDITKTYIWQLSHTSGGGVDLCGRGVKDFTLWGSTSENGTYTQIGGAMQLAKEAIGNNPVYTQPFNTSASGVRWLMIDVGSNWNGDASGYVGLSEIRFEGVPEPGTLVLLSAGLIGLLCYAWKKRK